MTREEAIKTLKGEAWICCAEKWNEALDTAIAALKAEPCEDAVSREAVLKKIFLAETSPIGSDNILKELSYSVENMPPVNPKQRTGEWIRQSNDYTDYYECEHCGIAVGLDDIKNFCPNCGAKMEGESE